MSKSIQASEENQKNIIPATETNIETQEFIYVPIEDSHFERDQQFFKLGGGYDGLLGWYFSADKKEKLEPVLLQFGLISFPTSDKIDLESLRNKNILAFYNGKLEKVEKDIRLKIAKTEFKCTVIEELKREEVYRVLNESPNGKLVIEALDKHSLIIDKISQFKTKKYQPIDLNQPQNITNVSKKSSCIPISKALKSSNFISVIAEKISLKQKYGKVPLSGISCGFEDLDETIDGFQKGHLIILAGRPSMGKSWVALNFIKNIAIEQNVNTAYYDFENGELLEHYRLASLCTGISSKKMREGNLEKEEFDELVNAVGIIGNSALFTDTKPDASELNNLIISLKHEHKENGIKIVVIDLINVMKINGFQEPRHQEVGTIARTLKLLAVELQIPIIVICQLKREAATSLRPPTLPDLKESGALEENADVIIFVHREDYYEKDTKPLEVELIVAKNRIGETRTIKFIRNRSNWLLAEKLDIDETENRNQSSENNQLNNFPSMQKSSNKVDTVLSKVMTQSY